MLIPPVMLDAVDDVDGELDADCPCSPLARRITVAVMRRAVLALESVNENAAAVLLDDWRGQIERMGGHYEDADREQEIFVGEGATEAALKRFEQAKTAWNCHLFRRVAVG